MAVKQLQIRNTVVNTVW